jgi:hypothetical protein
MNSVKSNMNLPNQTGSFVLPSGALPNQNAAKHAVANANQALTTATNKVNEFATNAANSLKEYSENALSTFTDPLKESYSASMESNTSPLISIPMIIILGLLVIALIVIIVFRDQVSLGLEIAWRKTKAFFASEPAPMPAPLPSVMPAIPIDKVAINNILPGKKEVFNLAMNKYKYSNAEPVCKAFGAELATYDQVKEAWNKGADWCNYGWIKGQAAVYPTQQSTYDKLQEGPEDQRSSCGVPGVNGGYFDNPDLQFGVNCYGTKPTENEVDTRHTMQHDSNLTPETLAYDKQVQGYKASRGEIPLNPFKTGGWSA